MIDYTQLFLFLARELKPKAQGGVPVVPFA